jgi:hypothetical protein
LAFELGPMSATITIPSENPASSIKPSSNLLYQTRSFQITLSTILLFVVLIHLYSVATSKSLDLVTSDIRAWDFLGFFETTRDTLSGAPFDLRGRFYKPPFFAVLLSLLIPMGFPAAAVLFQCISVITVVAVTFCLCRVRQQPLWVAGLMLLAITLSFPFAFLIDRGNVDALSLGLSFFAVLSSQRRSTLMSALLFALAVHIKTNVLAIAPVLWIRGDLKSSFQATITGILMIAIISGITPEWTVEWIVVLKNRMSWIVFETENGSLARAFLLFTKDVFWADLALRAIALSLVAGLVTSMFRKFQFDLIDRFLLFLPLCQAYPHVSYIYGYVYLPLLLLLYCRIMVASRTRSCLRQWLVVFGCGGIALSCFPSYSVQQMFNSAIWPWVLPALGLLCILVVNSILIWLPIQEETAGATLAYRSQSQRILTRIVSVPAATLLSFAAAFSLWQFFIGSSSGPLWFPARVDAIDGVPVQGTPFRARMISQGYGYLRLNCSVYDCRPLSISGVPYQTGLGTHADSELVLFVPAGTKELSGMCGLDDGNGGQAAGAYCLIQAGSELLFRSPPLSSKNPISSFRIPLKGTQEVTLISRNTGSSNNWNHIDWVGLKAE